MEFTSEVFALGLLQLDQPAGERLELGDVGTRSVPLDDVSLLIAQRHGADQEPAIFPVSAAQTHFILGRFPSSHVHNPLFHDPWKVLWMNYAICLFKCLLQREARIFQPTLIDE